MSKSNTTQLMKIPEQLKKVLEKHLTNPLALPEDAVFETELLYAAAQFKMPKSQYFRKKNQKHLH